jgi:hypothetical protein
MARSTTTRIRIRALTGGAVALLALGLAVPAASASVSDACPARDIQRIWDGGTSYNPDCKYVPGQLSTLDYPGTMFSTAMQGVYRGDVVAIQLRLRDLSYSPMAVDGHYGRQTAAAITRFQRSAGDVVDGKTGAQTWRDLFGQLPEFD